jgi:O-antigen/teichoic acid export membrane protein
MEDRNTSTLLEPGIPLPGSAPVQARKEVSPKAIWRRMHGVSPFASNVALTVAVNGLIALAGLVTGPLCARLLGPSGRGELAAIQNLYWVVAILAMLGMPEATLYFTAGNKNKGKNVLVSGLVTVLLASPVFFLIFFRLAPVLLAAQSPQVARTAGLCLLGIPLYAISNIPLFALRGQNDLNSWNLLRFLPTLGWLVLLLVISRTGSPTPQILALGYLLVLAVSAIPILWFAHRRLKGDFTPEKKSWGPMLKYGFPLAGAAVPYHLNLRLDQMLMAAFLPASSLGLYVVGVSWSGAVGPILIGIGTVLFPRVASALPSRRAKLLAQGTRFSVVVAIFVAAVIGIGTRWMIPLLFGKAFRGSIVVGTVLVVAAAISGLNIVMEEGLRGLGEPSSVFWGETAGLVITIGSLAFLLPRFGILGAGLASVLGYLGTSGILLVRACVKTGFPLSEMLILKSQDLELLTSKVSLLHSSTKARN